MTENATDWTLVSLSPLGGTTLIIASVLVVLAALFVVWSYRGAQKRVGLIVTRLLGAVLVLGFLTEPALQLRIVRKIKNRLAIVVDRSRSMSLASEGGQRRYDAVLAAIEQKKDELKALSEAHVIEWFDLEGPVTPAALSQPPVAESSDLVTALEKAREAGGGKPLAGIILISDGADNAALEGQERGRLSADAKARLSRLGAPVSTLRATGAGFKDVSLAELRADEFAFVHNTFEVEVVIEARGFAGATVPVVMKREGEVVSQQSVVLQDGPTTVSLKSKPDKIGEFVYSVSVPTLSGEAVLENNERSFVLQVIRDKIRVLQVSGRPSWDERFLRQHLKENPNVDLISFFILRTPTDVPGAPENELSLIPFPVEKLFTTELRSFDVVIFQNFDYRPYKMRQYLPNIRDAVLQSGLGFVMIGGEQSFAGGGYLGTELEEILPLTPDTGDLIASRVAPQLTEAGRSHPITDLARGTGRNDGVWKGLTGWTTLNRTGALSPQATALALEPSVPGADGRGAPLIAVMDAGQGRTMAVATDSMWRWRFAQGADGGGAERAYHRFWSNALRWLVRDPEHSRVRVVPERRRFELTDPVDVSVSVLGQDYQPVPNAHLTLSLEHNGTALATDELTTGEGGSAKRRYPELPPGAFRITAKASASGRQLGEGQGVFVVEARSVELLRGAPRPDLLAAIADATGGRAADLDTALTDLEIVDPDVVEVDRRRNLELWDNAWAMVLGVALFAADWALRRRRGYL